MKAFLNGFLGALQGMVFGAALMGGIFAFFVEFFAMAAEGSDYTAYYLFLLIICGIAGAWINSKWGRP